MNISQQWLRTPEAATALGCSQNHLRAPRKIGPAESIGQGRRLLGQESQSVLPGQTGIFRGALNADQ